MKILTKIFLFISLTAYPAWGQSFFRFQEPCKEGTQCKICWTYQDQNGQPQTIDDATLYINEQSTKTRILSMPVPTPTGTWTSGDQCLTLPLCASRMITARDNEDHVITVTGAKAGISVSESAVFNNINLPGIQIVTNGSPTPANCAVAPYVTPTPTATP